MKTELMHDATAAKEQSALPKTEIMQGLLSTTRNNSSTALQSSRSTATFEKQR
jgi:hypothetical protein